VNVMIFLSCSSIVFRNGELCKGFKRSAERMGDAKIKEEGILEARFSFPFVLSRLCHETCENP